MSAEDVEQIASQFNRVADEQNATSDAQEAHPKQQVERPAAQHPQASYSPVLHASARRDTMPVYLGRNLPIGGSEQGEFKEKGSLRNKLSVVALVAVAASTIAYNQSPTFKDFADDRLSSASATIDDLQSDSKTPTTPDIELPASPLEESNDTRIDVPESTPSITPSPSVTPSPSPSPSELASASTKPGVQPLEPVEKTQSLELFESNVANFDGPQTNALVKRIQSDSDVSILAVQGVQDKTQYSTILKALGKDYDSTSPWSSDTASNDQMTFYDTKALTPHQEESGLIEVPGEKALVESDKSDVVRFDVLQVKGSNTEVGVYNFDIPSSESDGVTKKSKIFNDDGVTKRELIASKIVDHATKAKIKYGKNAILLAMGDAGVEDSDRKFKDSSFTFFTENGLFSAAVKDKDDLPEHTDELVRRQVYVASDADGLNVVDSKPVGKYGHYHSTLGVEVAIEFDKITNAASTDVVTDDPTSSAAPSATNVPEVQHE